VIEHRTLATAGGTVADRHSNIIAWPRGPISIDNFQRLERPAYRNRKPRFTVISGSAPDGAQPVKIDLKDYAETKAPPRTTKRTNPFLRSAVGPLAVLAAAAVVATTLSVLPAPDRPALVDGPLAGHSLLHFPR